MLPEKKSQRDGKISRLIKKGHFSTTESPEVAFQPGSESAYNAIKDTIKKIHRVYSEEIIVLELPKLPQGSEPEDKEEFPYEEIKQKKDPAQIRQALKQSLENVSSGTLNKKEAERFLRSQEAGTWMIWFGSQENKMMATVKMGEDVFRHEPVPYCEANPVGYLWLRFGGESNFFKV